MCNKCKNIAVCFQQHPCNEIVWIYGRILIKPFPSCYLPGGACQKSAFSLQNRVENFPTPSWRRSAPALFSGALHWSGDGVEHCTWERRSLPRGMLFNAANSRLLMLFWLIAAAHEGVKYSLSYDVIIILF